MDKKKLQQLIVMMPLLLIGGVFAYYKYLLSPLNEQAQKLNGDLEKIKQEYRHSEERAARLPRLQQEITVLNQEISQIEKRLPPRKDLPGLIRMLSKKMNQHNIVWTRLAPDKQVAKDYYIEHSYTIPFTASYHHLAAFLSEIGQMEQIFAARFTHLGAVPDPKGGPTRISGELTFLTYTSKE